MQQTLHSATKDLGLLIMFLGMGLFGGSLLYGRFGARFSQYRSMFFSLVMSGIMLVVFSVGITRFPLFYVAATLAFFLGVAISPIMIASNTIIHRVSESSMRGKIFSSLEIVMHLGFLLTMFISSFLAEKFSHLSILVSVGIFFSLFGIVNLLFAHRISWLD